MSKPKKVSIELIDRDSDEGRDIYLRAQALVDEHHDHLRAAHIALAWKLGWKPNPDGRLKLGECRRASELDVKLHGFDFVILLNRESWIEDLSPEQQDALLDHELSHAVPQIDEDGDQKVDAEGRLLWRIRGHDLEEFHDVVARHGFYKGDVETFARVCAQRRQEPLFSDQAEALAEGRGLVEELRSDPAFVEAVADLAPAADGSISTVTISHNGQSVTLTPDDRAALKKLGRDLRRRQQETAHA